jgi:hypothetical protein
MIRECRVTQFSQWACGMLAAVQHISRIVLGLIHQGCSDADDLLDCMMVTATDHMVPPDAAWA